MPTPKKILSYLNANKIKHEILKHKKVFTAYDAAQTLGEDIKKIAKTLLVKADKDYYIVSVPANMNLDIKKLGAALKAKKVSIPNEKDMAKVCKIKPGAMSAFGSLYKLPVVLDKGLLKAKDAVFSTGDFMESVRLKVKDYADVEGAILGNVGVVRKVKPQKNNPSASSGRGKAIPRCGSGQEKQKSKTTKKKKKK
ncbi:YbaK/EbsC family protein [Candidatus Falkowbacteria bacterium]|nr:YbaK/EbsC family protein [Candidatus Falkowbacteria bacterium]